MTTDELNALPAAELLAHVQAHPELIRNLSSESFARYRDAKLAGTLPTSTLTPAPADFDAAVRKAVAAELAKREPVAEEPRTVTAKDVWRMSPAELRSLDPLSRGGDIRAAETVAKQTAEKSTARAAIWRKSLADLKALDPLSDPTNPKNFRK